MSLSVGHAISVLLFFQVISGVVPVTDSSSQRCQGKPRKVWEAKAFLSDTRQPEMRPFLFWYVSTLANLDCPKCLYSFSDDLPESLGQSTVQECKKSTSGWSASLKNVTRQPEVEPKKRHFLFIGWLLVLRRLSRCLAARLVRLIPCTVLSIYEEKKEFSQLSFDIVFCLHLNHGSNQILRVQNILGSVKNSVSLNH